jgi:hypothetical protein
VIFAIMMVVLMGAAAMSIDMSRIWHLHGRGNADERRARGREPCTKVGVEMVASFKLKKVYPAKSKNGDTPSFDKNEISGEFVPAAASGPVGPGPTTLTRLILVNSAVILPCFAAPA